MNAIYTIMGSQDKVGIIEKNPPKEIDKDNKENLQGIDAIYIN